MVRESLSEFLHQRRPRRVLLVSPEPSSHALLPEGTLAFRVSPRGQAGAASVVCSPGQLPFQSRVFDLVLVEHTLCDGSEPGLGEIDRVLEGGGHLVVLGLGYWGSHYRWPGRRRPRTAIRPLRLCRALERRDFTIDECRGSGLAGARVALGDGVTRPLVGFSDEVLIRARSRGVTRIVTPLRFGRTQAVGVRRALPDGMRRDAVA